MKIAATQFNLEQNALEIYVSGCTLHCKGCHNPELQSFDLGTGWKEEMPKILNKINEFNDLIKSIWILGGEPQDQNLNDLKEMLKILNQTNLSVWLFTGYNEVKEELKPYLTYIKTGKYNENLKSDNYFVYGIQLASTNQKLYKIR